VSFYERLEFALSARNQLDGIPAKIPPALPEVFENSEFAVFKVHPERLTETTPES
jgi:hypothetical protein